MTILGNIYLLRLFSCLFYKFAINPNGTFKSYLFSYFYLLDILKLKQKFVNKNYPAIYSFLPIFISTAFLSWNKTHYPGNI